MPATRALRVLSIPAALALAATLAVACSQGATTEPDAALKNRRSRPRRASGGPEQGRQQLLGRLPERFLHVGVGKARNRR